MLLTQALARNDEAEARRLHDTTPMKVYRAPEIEFDFPFRVTWHLVYFLSIQLNMYIGKLDMLEKLGSISPGIVLETVAEAAGCLEEKFNRELHADGGVESNNDAKASEKSAALTQAEDTTAEIRGVLEDFHKITFNRLAREAAAVLTSFDRFTRQVLDLDGLTVLRAWMSPVADAVAQLGIMQHEPDTERMAEWGQFWGRFWNRKMAFQGLSRESNGKGQNHS